MMVIISCYVLCLIDYFNLQYKLQFACLIKRYNILFDHDFWKGAWLAYILFHSELFKRNIFEQN